MRSAGRYSVTSAADSNVSVTSRPSNWLVVSNPDARITVPCPKCGEKESRLLAQIRANEEFICTACGHRFVVKIDGLDAFLKRREGGGN